jgi:hypothetical protein
MFLSCITWKHIPRLAAIDNNSLKVIDSLTHSWSRALLEKPPAVQLLQELPNILWNPEVHYRIHKSPSSTGSYPEPDRSIPPYFSLRSILILSTHLRLGLPRGRFPSGFPISYMHFSSPHLCYMSCPSHPPWLDHSNYTWRRVHDYGVKNVCYFDLELDLNGLQFTRSTCLICSLWIYFKMNTSQVKNLCL